MPLALTITVWVVAVIGSLAALGNKEPLDRLRVLNLWLGGLACWALTHTWWSPTQVAAGVMLADALFSFVLIGVLVAIRVSRRLDQDRS